jgi:hypothetical protein
VSYKALYIYEFEVGHHLADEDLLPFRYVFRNQELTSQVGLDQVSYWLDLHELKVEEHRSATNERASPCCRDADKLIMR